MTDRTRTRAFRPTTALPAAFAAAVLAVQLLNVAPAAAYIGSGDTGWTENNQRDCCADAVGLAQDNSAAMCENSGGRPKINRSFDRGLCNWDTQGDDDDPVYRCTATADVDCW